MRRSNCSERDELRRPDGATRFVCRDDFVVTLQAAGLHDFDAVMSREMEVVKATLTERQTHRFSLPDGRVAYLKRYATFRSDRRLLARLDRRVAFTSPAEREWRVIERLGELGVPTTPRIAFGERPRAATAFVMTLSLPPTRSLEDVVAAGELDDDLVERIADLLRRMHAGGVNHRDFYANHVLVGTENEARGEVFIVDLNRADIRRRVARRWRVKDLAALHFSVPARQVGFRLRLRFLRAYLGGSLRAARPWIRDIDAKAQRIRRHVERRLRQSRPNYHLNE